jgi:hypothetical protein
VATLNRIHSVAATNLVPGKSPSSGCTFFIALVEISHARCFAKRFVSDRVADQRGTTQAFPVSGKCSVWIVAILVMAFAVLSVRHIGAALLIIVP